mmetsp:Transcript_18367/g.63261  ORF Transcript_18367/g.63261 Transcript_18367/m.63261 type:complete len:86 (-) Transcript_18367:732-989(-)
MRPLSITTMLSARRIVASRCATVSVVRPRAAASRASMTTASDCASSADVASSRSSRFGSRTRARAMATRCFSPPLSLECSPSRSS